VYSENSVDSQPVGETALLVDVFCKDSEPPRIVVFGELDEVSGGQLQKAVVDVLRHRRPSCIEIDVHGVTFLDSAGIRTLVLSQADARQLGCHIRVTKPQPIVYRVLEITGLLEHFGLPIPQPPNVATRDSRNAARPDEPSLPT
jgi:anti-sigma B factor antagonist